MNNFHFLRPEAFLLLLPFTLLLFMLWRRPRSHNSWAKHIAKHLLPFVLKGNSSSSTLPLILLATAATLSVTALAGPSWQAVTLPIVQEGSGLVIALDLTPSMYAEDVKPSRLKRALYKIKDILSKRTEGQTALIAYTDEAFVVTPLTDDTRTIAALLSSLDPSIMPTQGIKTSRAIDKATDLLKQAGVTEGAILLVTPDAGNTPLKSEYPVSILGIGTEQGAPIPRGDGGFAQDAKGGMLISKLNTTSHNQILKGTKGRYAPIAADDSDINYILQGIGTANTFKTEEALTLTRPLDGGYWVILLSLPFAALLLRRGGYLAIPMILLSTNLHALSWDDLWYTSDQQGQTAFEQGEYQTAAGCYENPLWQAASNYRCGNFKEAAECYAREKTPDGYYNLGNALAKQGQTREAIAAYAKALEIDPEHEDAAYNKKVLEEQQEQQEQEPQNGDDDQKDDGKKNDDGKGDQENNQGQSDDKKNDGQNDDTTDQKDKGKEDSEDSDDAPPEKPENSDDLNQEDQDNLSQQIDQQLKDQDSDENKETESEQEASSEPESQQDLDDRWLDRVPDDPGALLRRKFLYQYRNQKGRS